MLCDRVDSVYDPEGAGLGQAVTGGVLSGAQACPVMFRTGERQPIQLLGPGCLQAVSWRPAHHLCLKLGCSPSLRTPVGPH